MRFFSRQHVEGQTTHTLFDRARPIGVVLLLLLALAPVQTTGAATPSQITECGTIDSPGTYRLANDILAGDNETCILITASDVVLDGQGHTIEGESWENKIGIHVNGSKVDRLSSVSLRDVVVTGWNPNNGAIYYERTDVGAIGNVTSISNSKGANLYLRGVTAVNVTDVVTSGAGAATAGTYVVDSWNVRIVGHDSSSDGRGVRVSGSHDVVVKDSMFDESSPAVDVMRSGGVIVHNNTMIDGSIASIRGSDGAPSHFTNNRASRTWSGSCGGFTINGAENDVIANNTISRCFGTLLQNSEGVTFENNSVSGGDGYGIFVNGGYGHHLIDNHIENNGRGWTPKEGIFLSGTERAYLSGNTMLGNGYNLKVWGGWPTLDHTIDASNTVEGRPVAYHVNETDVVVDPNAGWVGLVGTRNATIDGIDFPDNNYDNVRLWEADDTLIHNVTASGSQFSLWIDAGSDRTRVINSTFDEAGPMDLQSATFTHFEDTVIDPKALNALAIYDSPDTRLENVTINGASSYAVNVQLGSERLTIRNSNISDNGRGIYLHRASDSTIANSTISGNDRGGIAGQRFLHGVMITGNTISGNGGNGVSFSNEPEFNVIANNTIRDNAGSGIRLGYKGQNDTINGNILTGNDVGVEFPSIYESARIYDNHFNNTVNVDVSSGVTRTVWNVSESARTNIIGGPSIGGNHWALPNGTGFSQTCTDADDDGFCDAAFDLLGDGTQEDALPLAPVGSVDVPDIDTNVTQITFGVIDVSETASGSVLVENVGDADLSVTNIGITGTDAALFTMEDGAAFILPPGESQGLNVTYDPTEAGSHAAAIELHSDDPDEPTVTIDLTGTATLAVPDIATNVTGVDFGNVTVTNVSWGQVLVENLGDADLSVSSLEVTGENATMFTVADDAGFVLAPGDGRDITLTYSPGAAGDHTASLELASDDPDEAVLAVALEGTGVALGGSACAATVAAGEAIQAALDAALPGNTICVDPGVFNETLEIVTDNITLLGGDGVALNGTGLNGSLIFVNNATGVTVDGFVLQNMDNRTLEGVRSVNATGLVLKNLSALAAVANNTTAAFSAGDFELNFQTGNESGNMSVQVDQSTDPSTFGENVTGLRSGVDGVGFTYLNIDSQDDHTHGAFASVNISVAFDPQEVLDRGLGPAEMAVYYWNGTDWVNTRAEDAPWIIEGPTADRDRTVLSAGVDLQLNRTWAEMNRTSIYALGGMRSTPAPSSGSGGSGGGGGGGGAAWPGAVVEVTGRVTYTRSAGATAAFAGAGSTGADTDRMQIAFPSDAPVQDLVLGVSGAGRVSVLMEVFDVLPEGAPSSVPSGFEATGPYLMISVDPSGDAQVSEGMFQVRTDAGTLGGHDPSQGVVLHGVGGAWEIVETDLVASAGPLVFAVTTGSFSPFVLSVDVAPPALEWLDAPEGDLPIPAPESFSVGISDNRAVHQVQMFLDDEELDLRIREGVATHTVETALMPGEHLLRAVVTDESGLSAAEERVFVVESHAQDDGDQGVVAEGDEGVAEPSPIVSVWMVVGTLGLAVLLARRRR